MAVTQTTKRVLAFKSGGICAFPKCGKPLAVEQVKTGDVKSIGEAAHIAGEHAGAERYVGTMTEKERDHFRNLIYLCPNHHTEIDKDGGGTEFPTPDLMKLKSEHEAKALKVITDGFKDVAFAELELATKWLIHNQPLAPTLDMTLASPDDKIAKNGLSDDARMAIRQGIGLAKEVQTFVEAMTVTDPDFAERLKAGFLEEYNRLVKEGVKGDDRFQLMWSFASQGMKTSGSKAAATTILVYLFERCEVFEK